MEIDQSGGSPPNPHPIDEEEYDDIPYDDELERTLRAAESQSQVHIPQDHPSDVCDIEDLPLGIEEAISPFQQFRKKGYLSVSDLVGPVWCETQYDYRLRTLPYLPPSQRPDIIKSKEGNEIVVDKIKVEGKEKILKRGEKIHKRLEREIHPEEIRVPISTEEDIWGLRFLNMLAAMEALLVLGKCRELPVVGFVKGVLVYGVIDEIVREPIHIALPSEPPSTQTSLKSFFTSSRPILPDPNPKTHRLYISDSKTRASNVLPREEDTLSGRLQVMLYKELLDAILLSSTSTSTSLGLSQDSSGGSSSSRSILPSRNAFSWEMIFAHLTLDPDARFSEGFLEQSKAVVVGNGLRYGSDRAKNLNDLKAVWDSYVKELGLGSPLPHDVNGRAERKDKGKAKEENRNLGRTEDSLKLVYRRAGGKKDKKERRDRKSKRRRRGTRENQKEEEPPPTPTPLFANDVEDEEKRLIELAIQESLKSSKEKSTQSLLDSAKDDQECTMDRHPGDALSITRPPTRTSEEIYWGEEDDEDSKEEDELAWAVEMSLVDSNTAVEVEVEDGQGIVNVLKTPVSSQQSQSNPDGSQRSSSRSSNSSRNSKPSQSPSNNDDKDRDSDNLPSGTIIGTHRFTHSPLLLARHLENVLQFWMGEREPFGVTLEQTKRCGWCEFEEGCEWR
uniref:Exonuclease V n=1 Tax=Kwoniella bestiolae CBS 10118 TaxID=1296100 RepID=A0A1B9GBR3_9TREE|nr:hypothetical protein I302_03321 [Kwoniella bestiolae CBS 10118]OCF28462.1 hypothetical protein I302_03321 [Kwoniella bestiolae CBS 10118]